MQEVASLTSSDRPQLSNDELLAHMSRVHEMFKQWRKETAEREAAGLPARDFEDYRAAMSDAPDAAEPDAAS